jgi:hypothetical protein
MLPENPTMVVVQLINSGHLLMAKALLMRIVMRVDGMADLMTAATARWPYMGATKMALIMDLHIRRMAAKGGVR